MLISLYRVDPHVVQQKYKQHENGKDEWMVWRPDRFSIKSPSERIIEHVHVNGKQLHMGSYNFLTFKRIVE